MSMTLAEARSYVDKGLAKAHELGLQLSLAVVDEFGQLVQLDRMDGASLMSPDIAEAKAITALNFRRPTSQLVARRAASDDRVGFRSEMEGISPDVLRSIQASVHFNILAAGGGVPIYKDGQLTGAIGVSGATSEQDEQVANGALE